MKKYRFSTTISPKHYSILKKHADKGNSQQKVVEHALELLENSPNSSPQLSAEEKLWIRMHKEFGKNMCIIHIDSFKHLLGMADLEQVKDYVIKNKPFQVPIEWYYLKPLKECSMQEVIDGLVWCTKLQNTYDTINSTESDDHFTLKIIHDLGLKTSNIMFLLYDSVLESYGVKRDSHVSERSIFIKIFKNNGKIDPGPAK